jgi:cytochrome c peroxidase
MNLTGLRYYPRARFFWDDRGGNLEEMVLLPVRNPIEMGEDPARLPLKLAALPYYPELFRRAFGDPAITEARMARALAQFLRSLVSYRSRFDMGWRAPRHSRTTSKTSPARKTTAPLFHATFAARDAAV